MNNINTENNKEQNNILNYSSKVIFNKEEPLFRRIKTFETTKRLTHKQNLKLQFLNSQMNDSNKNYKGRNYKGTLINILSNKDKPVGILQSNSSSQSNNNSSLIKSSTISNRPLSSSFNHIRNLSFSLNLSQEVHNKRKYTFRKGTYNTFNSTSETDKNQDTIESTDRNRKRFLRKQLSKISENPKNKNYIINNTDNGSLNDNYTNLNNSLMLNKNFGSEKKESFQKRESIFIGNPILNNHIKMRINSALNHKRSSSKKLTNIKKLLYNNFFGSYDSCDNQTNKKILKLKEICSNLIEKNKLRENQIKNQKEKFISFFSIKNNENDKSIKHKNSLISLCIKKVKKFMNFVCKEKKYGKTNFQKFKDEMLINEKERKILMKVTKYYFLKMEKNENEKERTNIVDLKYAYQLSKKYFKIQINPKNISAKLENGVPSNLFESFQIVNDVKRRGSTPLSIFQFRNLFVPSTKKNSNYLNKLNVFRITLRSLKYINTFILKDYLVEKNSKYKQLVYQMKTIKFIASRNKIFKSMFKKKTMFTIKSKMEKKNNELKDKYEKPFFPKEFYNRRLKKIRNSKIKRRTSLIQMSAASLTIDMKKNNIYLMNESLINNKEHTMLRTKEIKSQIESRLKSELEKLVYCIKDLNFYQFKTIFEQFSVPPNTTDKHGNTLLSIAIQSNSFQIANYLLNAGADPNISNVIYIYKIFFRKKEIILFIML